MQIQFHKTDDVYKDLAENFETRFDTSNYKLERLLPKRKNKNAIGLMKDELGGPIMKEFVGIRAKASIKATIKTAKNSYI